LRALALTSKLLAPAAISCFVQPDELSGVMRSYAAFNEEVVKRYEEWLLIQHYTPRTKQWYRRTVRTFIDYLKAKSVASVTHLDVRSYIAHLSEQGTSWSTAFDNLQVLRRFYDFLHLGGVVSYVAPRLVKMRDAPRKIPRTMSEFEVRKFLAAAYTLREKALVEFLYGTGCRVSEVTSLRVENVDFEARTARVEGKDRRGRVVLITERAGCALRAYIGNRKDGYVFQSDRRVQKLCVKKCNEHWIGEWKDYVGPGTRYVASSKYLGSARRVSYQEAKVNLEELTKNANLVRPKADAPLSTNAIRRILIYIGLRSGMRHVTPHMFRHSFATHLLDMFGRQNRIDEAEMGRAVRVTQVQNNTAKETRSACHEMGVFLRRKTKNKIS
jgi:site-specific recombinase XerD